MIKKEGFHKFVFYMLFIALGVFWAEVVSTNLPFAVINPVAYLAYGLLYVIFIDLLMRYEIRDFRIWYMFGALVGIITETYLAKVTFYGADMETYQVGGFAPGAIGFILLFYHAFFSFLAPCYVAGHFLKMPVNLPRKKWADIALFIGPLILAGFFVAKGLNVLPGSLVSAFALLIWLLVMRKLGKIKDVRLSPKARKRIYIITVLSYVIFFFAMSNTRAHGHPPLDIPIPALTITSLLVLAIFYGLKKYISQRTEVTTPISYDPAKINWKKVIIWAGIYYTSLTIFTVLAAIPFMQTITHAFFVILVLGGIATGVTLFLRSLYLLIIKVNQSH